MKLPQLELGRYGGLTEKCRRLRRDMRVGPVSSQNIFRLTVFKPSVRDVRMLGSEVGLARRHWIDVFRVWPGIERTRA